ncbi:hypothetical protein TrST_g13055 [Triparma strigata]|uniref:Alanine--tRNA ligase n=1 Tax=Triparma strigata TaxID=1606541 RepID=A0A9W7B7D4_9STRA|nr:hypothetical protein TrST_g13055 [Triparma strigata]
MLLYRTVSVVVVYICLALSISDFTEGFHLSAVVDGLIKRENTVHCTNNKYPEGYMMMNRLALTVPPKSLLINRRLPPQTSTLLRSTSTTTPDWPTSLVRSTFLNYFTSLSHHPQPSSPVVPLSDPTLLFTNAGMNQFKPIFLGQASPTSQLGQLKKAVNSQKCIRAGGKHNDLEDVGRDTYHHTFFEMLGSWSFGDYFKEEAVYYAWDLLTRVYGLEEGRLYATYFEGDEGLGLPPDLEARDLWRKYLPDDRILASNAADNFWEMGDTGPCGPCTEIHYDRVGGRDASKLVNADDPDVIEIWNVVFIEFNKDETGLKPLPNKHIDTGMGLERLASLLQNKMSNYDIDVFQPLFSKIDSMSASGPYGGLVGEDDVTLRDTAYRAIADHARALSFAIADGAVPSNEGRGYVLRRILRRGVRYGQQILGCERGFFEHLVPVVVETFGEAYPELVAKEKDIVEIIRDEEKAFGTMLDRGITYFDDLKVELAKKKRTEVSGTESFFMYDTLGFPIDLTELMAEEAGLTVDAAGFEAEMKAQKERSRMDRKMKKMGASGQIVLELIAEQTSYLAKEMGVETTDDTSKYGYKSVEGKVKAIFDGGDTETFGFIEGAGAGDYVGIITDKTSFYAESGGQEADLGEIALGDGAVMDVTDVQVFGGFVLHIGTLDGDVKVGDSSKTNVDYDRRSDIVPNHTTTHILNQALREVLGDTVDQRGSLVTHEKLRFDFTAKKALKVDQIEKVESFVKGVIDKKLPVYDEVVALSDAKKIAGVRAVFGEIYPDPVRVVSVGNSVATMLSNPGSSEWSQNSIEFCGGVHVSNTGDAEDFVVVEETAVSKGIRRIVGVTKGAARECRDLALTFESKLSAAEGRASGLQLDEVEEAERAGAALRKELDGITISSAVKTEMRARLEKMGKSILQLKKAEAGKKLNAVLTDVRASVVDKTVVAESFKGIDGKAGQKIVEAVKKVNPDCAYFGVIESDEGGGKIAAFCSVPEGKGSAGEWLKGVLGEFGGRGGGTEAFASGQATGVVDVKEVLKAAEKAELS